MSRYKEFTENYGKYAGNQKEFFKYLRIVPDPKNYEQDIFLQIHICRQILDKYKRINFKI